MGLSNFDWDNLPRSWDEWRPVGGTAQEIPGQPGDYQTSQDIIFNQQNAFGHRPTMQGYDRLTEGEKAIMQVIPAISASSWGQKLGSAWKPFGNFFRENPLGRAIDTGAKFAVGLLDVGAEFVERAAGLGVQLADADFRTGLLDDWKDAQGDELKEQALRDRISSAWYASSLAADFAELPKLDFETIDVPEEQRGLFGDKFVSPKLVVPNDLPGAAGVVDARKRIYELVQRGMTHKEALEQVKAEAYEDAGALSYRMAANDAWVHILGDPLNWVLPALRPIERTRAASVLARNRVAPAEIANLEAMLKSAKAAERTEDTVRLVSELENTLELAKANKQTLGQRFAKHIFADAKDLKSVDELTKAQELRRRWNPFSLTPESRAEEYVGTILNNLGSYVLGRFDRVDDVYAAVLRGAGGAVGDTFGVLMLTEEGRMFQGFYGKLAQRAILESKAWTTTAPLRTALHNVAEIVGEDVHSIMKAVEAGDVARLSEKMGQAGMDAAQINRTLDGMQALQGMPYTDEMAKTALLAHAGDIAGQLSLVRYGVKPMGLIRKAATALKSAETLAFLRVNPGFAIRNLANNVTTEIGRGILPGQSLDEMAQFWKSVGWEPRRLRVAFGVGAEDVGGALKGSQAGLDPASKVLRDASRGEPGKLDKIADFFSGINLGKLDFGEKSAQIEAAAGFRAYTFGTMKANNQFWKAGVGYDDLRAVLGPDAVARIEGARPGMIDEIMEAVADAKNPGDIDRIFRDGLENNVPSWSRIVDEVSQELGTPINAELADDFLAKLEDGYKKAWADGTLDEWRTKVDFDYQDYLSEQAAARAKTIADDMEEIISAEGPTGFLRRLGDITDEWWGGHTSYQRTMSRLDPSAITNPRARAQVWRRIRDMQKKYWNRQWNTYEKSYQGMIEGAKKFGIGVPDAVMDDLKALRAQTEEFFRVRNRMLNRHFDRGVAKGANDVDAWERISVQLDDMYRDLAEAEDIITRRLDARVIEGFLDVEDLDPRTLEAGQAWTAWRSKAADLRRADKEAVIALRSQTKGLSAEETASRWRQFWNSRYKSYEAMWAIERQGLVALSGGEEALQAFRQSFQNIGGNASRNAFLGDLWGVRTKTGKGPGGGAKTDKSLIAIVNNYVRGDYVDAAQGLRHVDEVAPFVPQVDLRAVKKFLSDYVGDSGSFKDAFWARVQAAGVDLARKDEVASALATEFTDFINGIPVNSLRVTDWHRDANRAIIRYLDNADVSPAEAIADLIKPIEEYANSGIQSGLTTFEEFRSLAAIPPELTQKALVSWARSTGRKVPELFDFKDARKAGISDLNYILKPEAPDLAKVADEHWMTQGHDAVEGIFKKIQEKREGYTGFKGQVFDNLDDADVAALKAWGVDTASKRAATTLAATRMGEFVRDSALLNYSRRNNFQAALTTVSPFSFWTTATVGKWALHSIDRPAMLSTYYKLRKMWEQNADLQDGFPKRLEGHMKFHAPFLPEWAGDKIFVDPLKLVLPFDNWQYPYERAMEANNTAVGRAERLLTEWGEANKYSAGEIKFALENQSGPVWEEAIAKVKEDDQSLNFDAIDFLNSVTPMHAPLVWAKEIADGTPEDIGNLSPLTRTTKGLAGLLGQHDFPISPHGLEAQIRKSLGLPEFSKWDEYYIDRALADMAATGEISVDEARLAMIERTGDVFDDAERRAWRAKGLELATSGLIGLQIKTYPEGEEHRRVLQDDFNRAYVATYVDETDPDALGDFFDKNPEYVANLALFKEPEERLRTFLVDHMWDKWWDMETIDKNEARDILGPDFEELFVNRDTRNTDEIPLELLQIWNKMLTGKPVGTMNFDNVIDIRYAPPEIARQAEVFYNTRRAYFPNYRDLQDVYFKIDEDEKAERRQYLRDNPELKQYWDWRREWLHRNPRTVPYLDDDFEFEYPTPEAAEAALAGQNTPFLSVAEWNQYLTPSVMYFVEDFVGTGSDIPDPVMDELEDRAAELGMSVEQIIAQIQQQVGP